MKVKSCTALIAMLLVLFFLVESNFSICRAGQKNAGKEDMLQECLADILAGAPAEMTVGEIRNTCKERLAIQLAEATGEAGEVEEAGEMEKRLQAERKNINRPFTIMAHRPNYFLLGAYNFQGYSEEEYHEAGEDISVDQKEAQFQISIKMPLAVDLFDSGFDIFAAYTAHSFWQLYNTGFSSPFRETNHEPEAWIQAYPDLQRFGLDNTIVALGLNHQSNGQSGNLSRSWNRVFALAGFNVGNLAFSVKPWIRIPEEAENDDNPDITDYLGHGEWRVVYKFKDNTFTMMGRNNLESGFSKGAVELGWSFPLFGYPYLKGYLQYFSGYGESLIDYDRYVNKIGVGLLLTDFL